MSHKNYPIKKSKNFGYTFSFIFILAAIYNFHYELSFWLHFFILSFIFFIISFFKPQFFRYVAYLWEKFGLLLGKIFSPVILTIVYIFTIIPIKLILKILFIDLINKKKNNSLKSYWIEKDKHLTNFKDQF
tara:strand:+ start:255 stop:647 length:393 start_codon:yes stop_codon:yes gene_type:complete